MAEKMCVTFCGIANSCDNASYLFTIGDCKVYFFIWESSNFFVNIVGWKFWSSGSYCTTGFLFFFAIAVDFATDITEAKNNTKLHFALINMNFRAEITMKHVYRLLGIINKCVCCLATK